MNLAQFEEDRWLDEGREGGRTGAGKFNDLYICVVLLFMKWN